MKSAMLFLATLVIFTATSCSKDRLKGEGPNTSDTRTPGNFTKIEANGSANITIVKDDVYKVIVTGHQNLVPAYETEVSNGTLTLEYDEKYWNVKNDNITVEVHTPRVAKLSINGSGNAAVKGGFDGSFEGYINGSGEMTVHDGSFTSLTANINGSGNIHAADATCEKGYAYISGSGNVEIRVTQFLSARISGSGDVLYWGIPQSTDINVSGSGSVKKKG